MKFLLTCTIVLFSFVCYSQSQKRIFNIRANEISSIGIFPPLSAVEILLFKDEKTDLNKRIRIEKKINEETKSNIDSIMNFIELNKQDIILDSIFRKQYSNEIESYMSILNSMFPNKKLSKSDLKLYLERLIVSDNIANIMKSNNQRFALYVVNYAIIRTQKSYDDVVKRNSSNPFLYGGGALPYLIFGGLTRKATDDDGVVTYSFIIDAETKKVVSFAKNINGGDISDKKSMMERQLLPCFEDFWVWYHSEAQQYLKIKRK